jgi:hypothetical protein
MRSNIRRSDREIAACLAREYFNEQISKSRLMEYFPGYENDFQIQNLFQRIENKPRSGWLFGVSRIGYKKFLQETFKIIEDLESNKLKPETMMALVSLLRLESKDAIEPIHNMGSIIFEAATVTKNSKKEIIKYYNVLLEKKIIENISKKPLLYQFTEVGKNLKTDLQIQEILENKLPNNN